MLNSAWRCAGLDPMFRAEIESTTEHSRKKGIKDECSTNDLYDLRETSDKCWNSSASASLWFCIPESTTASALGIEAIMVAASIPDRLLKEILASEYLKLMISPCSVIRTCRFTAGRDFCGRRFQQKIIQKNVSPWLQSQWGHHHAQQLRKGILQSKSESQMNLVFLPPPLPWKNLKLTSCFLATAFKASWAWCSSHVEVK